MSAVLALVAELPWRARFASLVAWLFNSLCLLLLPVMPVVMSILLRDLRFVRNYRVYLRKFVVHFQALREGPVQHYLADVFCAKNKCRRILRVNASNAATAAWTNAALF